ncbi:asparagine synthase (glutamine-hydrolyzing) [bacterium]|nr:asparagine synthase (glutamine-hydrolyzing) [bacterium]
MCGFCGVISLKDRPINVDYIKGMCDVIAHRGPDDAGYFIAQTGNQQKKGQSYHHNFTDEQFAHISPLLPKIDSAYSQFELKNEKYDLFLGHRRLAVIDPSPAGHQPMSDKSNNIRLVYNGEIYNFKELRYELECLGYEFKSHTDTEIIIYSYKEWGIDCVKRFNGMFAFAIWDNYKKTLYLARDRYGIKPLYYTILNNGKIIFGSEIKSILEYKEYEKAINLQALNEYFTFQNLFQYETLFKNIFLLPAANIARIDFQNGFKRSCYWDYNFTDRTASLSFDEAKEETGRLLKIAVKRQLIADVPVGSYLSGGMDSGSITSIAAQYIPRLTTFTAGFEVSRLSGIEATFDERETAELIANEFKTEHYEQIINAGDIAWAMPKLIWHLEDLRVGMCYSNYYISRLASKFVKVCLSGSGGDELYGGYPWRYYRVLKSLDRENFFSNYYEFWQRLVPDDQKRELFNYDIYHRIQDNKPYEIFRRVFTFNEHLRYDVPEDHIANSLYFEIKTFLHGLLIVGDKLSMANSLEERFPFLDNDLVDFSMTVPVNHKLKNLESIKRIDENELKRNYKYFREYDGGKNVLREAMKAILPESVTERKKQGFSSPDESWFRGENFEYVKDRLLASNKKIDKYLNKNYIEKIIKEHSEGINHRLLIWSFISFEEWCNQFNM